MPFTLSHPAIILPLLKSKYRLSATALIVGSLVPDFEFFLQMREVENIGHHWNGVLLFDLPLGLLCCFLFHNFLKNIFINNLPDFYRCKLMACMNFNWNKYMLENKWMLILSLFIGISSHIFLDSFTHHDGLFVTMFPILNQTIGLWDINLPIFFLLQIVLSIVGILIVLVNLFRNVSFTNIVHINNKKDKYYWPILLFTFITILSVRLFFWPELNTFWGIFMACMGAVIYSSLLVSIFFKKTFLKNNS